MTGAIMFDLDGTICNCEHRAHFITGTPKNWKAFYEAMDEDTPNEYVCVVARGVYWHCTNLDLVICTGRPEPYRAMTVAWLARNKIEYDRLLMRPDGDRRIDTIVKREMLDKLRDDGYEVLCAVDDRQQVIDMWWENKVPCLAVKSNWEDAADAQARGGPVNEGGVK